MKKEDDLLVYDDDAAVEFILKNIPDEMRENITADSINYILDLLYEFFEQKGLINEESTEEASIDEEEMLDFVVKTAEKEDVLLSEEEIIEILEGEYEYGKTLGIYFDNE